MNPKTRILRRPRDRAGHYGIDAVNTESVARLVPLIALLLPVSGALQRTLAYWASGIVPASLGAAASVPDLVFQGAGATALAAVPVGVVTLALLPAVRRGAFGGTAREIESLRRAILTGSIGQIWSETRRSFAQLALIRSRKRGIGLLVGVVFLALIVLGPVWYLLSVIVLAAFALAAYDVLKTWGRPNTSRLVLWAVALTLLSGLASALIPRPDMAPTVDVHFRNDAGIADGRFSLVGSEAGFMDLLPCGSQDQVVRVREDSVIAVRYVKQTDPPWARPDLAWMNPIDPQHPELWTPLWRALQGAPPHLGYVQVC